MKRLVNIVCSVWVRISVKKSETSEVDLSREIDSQNWINISDSIVLSSFFLETCAINSSINESIDL